MDKKEALYQIGIEIMRVEELCHFKGRAKLLKRLHYMQDLIALYRPSPNYYALIIKEAKALLIKLQQEMDNGQEDTGP